MTERRRAAGDTHPGLLRSNNEDRFFFDDPRGLYCVIDGVGGHNAGERAAEIAAATIRTALHGTAALADARLRDALTRANEAIFDAAGRDAALTGMACVATLAVVEHGRCRFVHVGDTRLYKIHGGRITKLTHDHSPVGELEDTGSLSEVDAMRHPRRNEIYRDLGSNRFDGQSAIESGEVAFEHDAALVLCSDGLSDQVSSGSVRRIVEAFAGSPALAVQELITAANDAGGKDNVTALVVEGEAFAAAIKSRSRSGVPAPVSELKTPEMPMLSAPRTFDRAAPPASAGWTRAAAGLIAGLALGAVGGAAAERFGLWQQTLDRIQGTRAPRSWHVGLQPSADFATIGEAVGSARSGDTVVVGPGEYREAVMFKSGVSIDGSLGSVLKPPLGAPAGWTAVSVSGVTSGRLSGLAIAGTAEQPVGTGVLVDRSSIVIEGIEISGATTAGVAFGPGGQPVLRQSWLHDNSGPGVVIRAHAEPRLEQNVILHSGPAGSPSVPAVLVEPGARPTLVANGLSGLGGPAVAGWPTSGLAELVRQNVISPNPMAVMQPRVDGRRRTVP